jgi:hypothetical protein
MIWEYLDESYEDDQVTRSTTTCVLGGGVAVFESWCRLVREWQIALRDENVAWFHAKEFHHYKGDFCRSSAMEDPR